ncbi:hypothetical protein P5G51_017010 [Virgibacillus sp. 179-BFC.A HS]|uniref:Uncharacterized protein n=1 Tax=Tigheibacillus jepli TaxID=3035914 RepID=A0ABU5CKE1_9BACI|nr:hypothetical protein [Virgibacillus sp. 179-BFC.A HS]MDY0406828.1 hypothetical protein [Virgibacillus sp. 179-BFC.A HS]
MELIGKSVDAHSLKLIVEVLGKSNNRVYTKSGDVLVAGTSCGKIKVNLSSAARIYVNGMAIVDRKSEILSKLKTMYQNAYLDDYENRQQNLIRKFNDMESSPGKFQYLLGKFSPDTQLFYQLKRISIQEQLNPLPYNGFKAAFENMFAYLEKDFQKSEDLLEQIQEVIEKLFDKDKALAENMGI